MRRLVSSWLPVVLVNKYGQNAVRAIIASQSSHGYTYPRLETVVFTTKCEICHEQGETLYVRKLMRCCFRCLSTDRRLLAVNVGYAASVLEAPEEDLKRVFSLYHNPSRSSLGLETGSTPTGRLHNGSESLRSHRTPFAIAHRITHVSSS